MSKGDLQKFQPQDGDQNHDRRHPGEPKGTAAHKLHNEATSEWHRQASEARKAPLTVHDGQKYTVQHGDCLSDIAARRLRSDNEKVDRKSIAKEEERLRNINGDSFHSMTSKDKKQRDFLADGWELKIYDSVHDAKKSTDTGKPLPGPADKTVPDKAPQVKAPEFTPPFPVPRPEFPGDKQPKAVDPPAEPRAHPRERHHQASQDPDQPHHRRHHDQGEPPPHHKRRHHGQHPQASQDGEQDQPAPGPKDRDARAERKNRKADNPEVPEKPDSSEPVKGRYGAKDRSRFYTHQTDKFSCSAVAMAMMKADMVTGHPPTAREVAQMKRTAGTTSHGYRGSLDTMAEQLNSEGLKTKAYEYGRFNANGMNDLDRELAQGHTAVARIINPHTGKPHYIFIAGKDSSRRYIIGDPDRKNNATRGHAKPISRNHLYTMMSGRDGFVAGWS